MIDERGELLAEGPGVPLVQVDLILRAAEGEPHRLIGRSPVKIILQGDGYLRCHPHLHTCDSYLHPIDQ